MHNAQRNQQLTNEQPAAIYRERSLLDEIMEAGIIGEEREAVEPAAPSLLDLVADQGIPAYPMGRRLVVRNVEIARQDADLSCQGGLFGSVEDAAEPSRPVHGTQIPLEGVEVSRGTGCCICGDGRCNIGPFVVTEGGR